MQVVENVENVAQSVPLVACLILFALLIYVSCQYTKVEREAEATRRAVAASRRVAETALQHARGLGLSLDWLCQEFQAKPGPNFANEEVLLAWLHSAYMATDEAKVHLIARIMPVHYLMSQHDLGRTLPTQRREELKALAEECVAQGLLEWIAPPEREVGISLPD